MARTPAREATEQALLAAIYAAPTDDAPRLVYADYLMERGDKRGVVIALQCGGRDVARAHRLLASHRRRWLGPLTAAIDRTAACTFERGFVATATLATAAPPELDEHPAWATLRHVQLPKAAKQRTGLLAHLARLGVTTTFPRALRRADTVLDDLTDVASGKSENTWWRGPRGLGNLGVGVDKKLVERVMRIILPWSAIGSCDALPDEYVPIAWRVLAPVKTPEATFLNAYRGHDDGARLRDACSWLYDFRMVDGERRNRHRLPALMEDGEAVHAALATVARHGLAAQRLLAVPAHLGDDAAVAAVQPTIVRALATRGLELDDLEKWFVPHARGPAMMAFVAAIADAKAARGATSRILPLLARFGAPGKRLVFDFGIQAKQVRVGQTRMATAYVDLNTHTLPNAAAAFVWNTSNHQATRWADGALERDEGKVGGPKSVEDLPRWLAAAAKRRKITWDPATVRVTSSLRGKPRAAAVAWLLGG